MSLDFRHHYGSYLDQQEREARELLKNPSQEADAFTAHAVLDTTLQTREAFREAGVSLQDFRVLDGTDHGQKVTMGAYERQVQKTGKLGLADTETLLKASDPDDIKEQVKATLAHELRHYHSHEEALKKGQAGMISQHFGAEIDHDLQETMARKGTTEGRDSYDAEQSRVNRLASQMRTSRNQLVTLLYQGEEAEIVRMGYESGYLKAA